MSGAEGGIRTHTGLLPTDFKSVSGVLTSFYDALPSSIYRRFSRQGKLTSCLVSLGNWLIYDYESTLVRGKVAGFWIAAACWRARQPEQLQVANHTCSIQFNKVEGRERFCYQSNVQLKQS